MKPLSIFIVLSLFITGLWLWAILFTIVALYLHTRDWNILRRKCYAFVLLWQSDAFFVYSRTNDNTEIKSWCSELDVIQMKSLVDNCIEQEKAVEDVQSYINEEL